MQDYHARAKQGIKLLMGRQVFVQALTFLGGVVLARVLTPAAFGLYAITTYLVALSGLIGDFGLAPSFIQRKADLTERDLRIGFTLQQIVTTVTVSALVAAAPFLVRLYPSAPPDTVWLLRALAFSLYLTSWRSMSALQLERQMRFDRLARIEVAEALIYQAVAVGLALMKCGVWSFVWATLLRGVLGVMFVYLSAPWRVRLEFDRQVAREVLRYGIPFQAQSLVNQLSSWITPLFVGSVIGPQAVGYLSWASSNGKKPLALVDNVMRVAFPHFSRIQDDPKEVERTLTRYLVYLLMPVGLWFAVLLVAGRPLVQWIYSDKWLPAVPALVLCASALMLDVIVWMTGVTLNSLGKISFTTKAVLARSILTVAGSIPLVFLIGFNGVPLAYLVVSVLIVPWLLAGLGVGAISRVLSQLSWLIVPVILSICFGEAVLRLPLPLQARAITTTVAVAAAYGIGLWFVGPEHIRESLRTKIAGRFLSKKVVAVGAAD